MCLENRYSDLNKGHFWEQVFTVKVVIFKGCIWVLISILISRTAAGDHIILMKYFKILYFTNQAYTSEN